jgi:hypothetical protein
MTSENGARLLGFTRPVIASSSCGQELFLLVKPDDDLDGRFKAFDRDECEMVYVNGWLATIEDGED